MAWIQIRIHANKESADQISDLLLDVGCPSVTFMDGSNTPVYEPKPGEVILWPETCLLYTSPSPRDRQKSRMPSSA